MWKALYDSVLVEVMSNARADKSPNLSGLNISLFLAHVII